ncbi:MAG TPA: DUF4406 domain-containing protein [Clostridia bacterium]|nr:DUF4406 domain-containing protein [Clostridia bacterium]
MDNELMRNGSGYVDPTAFEALQDIIWEERTKRLGYMPLTYICSPYKGDVELNVQNARRYCAFALSQGALPVAPHLLFPQFLGTEETEETRELALHMGLILLTRCRELWFFGDTVSEGMKREINRARWRDMIIRHFTSDCKEVPI